MKVKKSLLLTILTAAVTGAAIWSLAAAAADPSMKKGKVELKSIGALEFGPQSILFIADSAGSAVYAVEVKGPKKASLPYREPITDVDQKIAALLGTTPRDIFIKDMAVHEPSGAAFLSVMRGILGPPGGSEAKSTE